MFNDEKKQNVYRDKQLVIQTVFSLIFIMALIALSGCDDFVCVNPDNTTINLSVTGEGYFSVRTHKGIYYTRSSSFFLSQESKLINPQCYALQGWEVDENGYPRGAITDIYFQEEVLIETVSPDGVISVKRADGTIRPAALIVLAMFENPESLKDEGNGFYSGTEEAGQPCTGIAGGNCFDEVTFFGTIEFEASL